MKHLLFLVFFFFTFTATYAQLSDKHTLAVQYYNKGEYDKAVELFEDLYENDPSSDYYYRYYYNSLLKLQEFKKIDKVIKKQIKRDPGNITLYVDQGYSYSQQGNNADAQKHYQEALENLQPVRNQVIQLANAFVNIREFQLATEAYQKGRKIVKDYPFYFEEANLYKALNNNELMITSFLDHMNFSPSQNEYVLGVFQDRLEEDGFSRELQKQLYKRIQGNTQDVFYNEILIWLFIQEKDFESAFTQVKALDRRLNENGFRVYELARNALEAEEYDAASAAYKYLLDKGRENRFYFNAREGLLAAKKSKVISGYSYSEEDLADLEKEYYSFIEEFGANKLKAAMTLRDFATLQAFYLHDLDKGIRILEDLIAVSGLNSTIISECKLDLGDCYLMKGDIWDASLLYSQVDKKMKDEPLGEMARFKNAKLSYYAGDFGWAQSQLDVLKASTSELIANDALELSVFMTSNLGLDTSTAPMEMFSRADLLAYQNKLDASLLTLDSIEAAFPGHILGDNIYFLKANILLKKQDTEGALGYLDKISINYPDELLADDALYLLGDIYERELKNKEKAMEYFQRIILEYPGSVYVIDARERYRALRGDKLN